MDSKADNVFLPCGHMCTCTECYTKLGKSSNNVKCPMCRRVVIENIKK